MPERWHSELQKLRFLSPPEVVPTPNRSSGGRSLDAPARDCSSCRARRIRRGGSFAWRALGSNTVSAPTGSSWDRCARERELFANQLQKNPDLVLAGCSSGVVVSPDAVPAPERSPAVRRLPPDTVEVRCTRAFTTEVWTPRVRPQADGVHFSVTNTTNQFQSVYVSLTSQDQSSPLQHWDMRVAPASTKSRTEWLSPGSWSIGCADPTEFNVPTGASRTSIKLVDPLGVWGPTDLSCQWKTRQRFDVQGYAGYPHVSSPAEVEQNVGGLQAGDEIRFAGYPEANMWKTGPWFVVARSGLSIASVWFWQDHGAATVNACPGSGIVPPGHPWEESP
jgi:hypothetical protein